MRSATSRIRIGISGWTYDSWRGSFYPEDLPRKRELAYAAGAFPSVEVNGSFYSLQTPGSYAQWHDVTPPDFVFSVKGPRFITHMKKLRDCKAPLANFFASGVLKLGAKLGPILWQLPPQLRFDEDRLREFFAMLPRDTGRAAALARHHDDRVAGRACTTHRGLKKIRHALEVRHGSYVTPKFFALLEEHDIGLVVADTAGKWPQLEEVTSDFVYVRLHGDEELYVSGYSPEALDWWAAKVRHWARSRDVFVYFDNDAKVHAPFDAQSLMERCAPPRRREERRSEAHARQFTRA